MNAGWPYASAVAITRDRILAVGDDLRDMLAPGGQVLDLDGHCVLPGMIDSHVHFLQYALGLRELNLSDVASLDELQAMLAERARQVELGGAGSEEAPTWIVGQGWDQERWPERRFPTAASLDRVVPAHPVALTAKSCHALVANSVALRMAGIAAETPDPPGGRIGRYEDGRPNGVLFEDSAMRLVSDLIPAPGPGEVDRALRDAFPTAWQVGVTSVHDMDGPPVFESYQRLHRSGLLGLRIVNYPPAEMLEEALALRQTVDVTGDWLRVGGVKSFTDGALGPRTAAMLAPYDGEPENVGVLTMDEDTLRKLARRASGDGLPLATHAIGDRANRMVLDVLADVPPMDDDCPPHRIEHVQVLHADDVGRLAALGVVASMQPIHATQDFEMADRYWGARCATAYAWRSLLEAGTVLVFGSDCPVEDLNPFLGIHAAVTRRRVDGTPGPEGWYPEQRLTVAEAVHAFTVGAAYAGGMDDRVGSLVPGKLADLIVLDRDIFTCAPMEIAGTRVLATMLGGKQVHGNW